MGRLDDALRRVNRDVTQGTGAPRPAPSPWRFGRHDRPEPEGVDVSPGGVLAPPLDAPSSADEPERPLPRVNPASAARVDNERLILSKQAQPLHVEQFRTLAASLHQAQLQQPLKSVVVTSATPGDGKSYVSVNLALTLSESYSRRVLLIDADLRHPSLHLALHERNDLGLYEALQSAGSVTINPTWITERLALLPAGRAGGNPVAALASARLKQIVEAASGFDWVLLDTPPVGVLADARLAAEAADAALLVVRAGVTRFPDVEAAADIIGHERILGMVLNGVEAGEIRGEAYYGGHYEAVNQAGSER